MSTLIRISRKSNAKAPQDINGINWASPLARGLKALATVQRGVLREVVTGAPLIPTGSTPIAHSALGPYMDLSAASNYVDLPNTFNPADTDAATVAIWYEPFNLVGNHELLTNTDDSIVLRQQSGGNLIGYWRNGSGAYNNTGLGPADASSGPRLAATCRGANGDMYAFRNGVVVTSAADTPGLYSATPTFRIGAHSGGAANNANNGTYVAMWWDRALSLDEVWRLYDPNTRWDMIDQGYRTISLPGAAAAAGAGIVRRKR